MSAPRGRGLGVNPIEGIYIEMGWGDGVIIFDLLLTYGKENHVRIVNTEICLQLVQADQSLLFTFRISSKK